MSTFIFLLFCHIVVLILQSLFQPRSAVLILLLSITILDRKTVRTLDFLIPRMPIPQINGTAVC